MMRDSKLDPRLVFLVACPLVALASLALAVVSIAGGEDSAYPVLRTLGVIGLGGSVTMFLVAVALRPAFETTSEVATVDAGANSKDLEAVVGAAEELANDRLPALLRTVTDGTETPTAEPFELALPDGPANELGQLIDSIQVSAYQAIAIQHDTIQARLGDLVVNLVRRSQSLLDRQLAAIDELETGEEDPDRLEQLYGVDMLATRMRRNAESLLVLAGAEPPRRRNGAASASDIIRVAVSEIENYRQIDFAAVAPAAVSHRAVTDIAHLLSELLENATAFSPPEATVSVEGQFVDDGYQINVVDSGIGISPDQADEFNRILSQPPGLSFDMSRALGFMVVGRLAQRHAIDVTLSPGSPTGTKVSILIPSSLLVDERQAEGDASDDTTSDALSQLLGLGAKPESESADDDESSTDDDVVQTLPTRKSSRRRPRSRSAATKVLESDESDESSEDEELADAGARSEDEATHSDDAVEPDGASAEADDRAEADGGTESSTTPEAKGKQGGQTTGAAKKAGTRRKPAAKRATTKRGSAKRPTKPAATKATATNAEDKPTSKTETDDQTADQSEGTKPPATTKPAARSNKRKRAAGSPAKSKSTPPASKRRRPPAESKPAAAEDRPASLDDALPTGGSFTSGVEALLASGITMAPEATGSGASELVTRDRSKSYAPISEGRDVPTESGSAAVASTRDPEEVRNRISRYRRARKKPINPPAADESSPRSTNNGDDS